MPRNASNVSEAQYILKREGIINRPLTNDRLGIVSTLSGKSVKKMADTKATGKSITPALHAKAIANIDILYENADFDVTHPDYKNNEMVKQIHRLGSLMFNESTKEYIPIMITLKEFIDCGESRIYSVEVLDIKQMNSAGQPTALSRHNDGTRQVPIAEFILKMQDLIDKSAPPSG